MLIRASCTFVLVVSLLANDILTAVYGRHAHFTTSKDTLVSQYAAPSASSALAPSNSSTNVHGAEFFRLPKSTSIIAAGPSTRAAAPTTTATDIMAAIIPAAAAATSSTSNAFKKRGLAYNDAALTQFFIGSNSKVSWAYNWGQKASGLASGLEYVPMLWNNHPSLTGPWATAASNAIASGSSHLFSFNEPDVSSQANMDVNTAAQAYMSYIEPFAGKAKLGAPAVTNGGGSMGLTYLSSFIFNCSGCTIDFVNIHWYDSATNIAYFKSHVEQAYSAGGNRPVWITEFAATGTEDEQNNFLKVVIPWLDAQPYVERYAYFMCSQGVLVSGNRPSTLGTTFLSLTS